MCMMVPFLANFAKFQSQVKKEFGPRTSSAILPQLIGLAEAQKPFEGTLIWGIAVCGVWCLMNLAHKLRPWSM